MNARNLRNLSARSARTEQHARLRRGERTRLGRDRRMYDLPASGGFAAAEREMRSYLDDAEAQLMKAYREADGPGA